MLSPSSPSFVCPQPAMDQFNLDKTPVNCFQYPRPSMPNPHISPSSSPMFLPPLTFPSIHSRSQSKSSPVNLTRVPSPFPGFPSPRISSPQRSSSSSSSLHLPHLHRIASPVLELLRRKDGRIARPCLVPGCGKLFASEHSRRVHVETVHEKKKKFECELCGKRYGQISHKNRHMLLKHHVDLRQSNRKGVKSRKVGIGENLHFFG